MYLNKNFIIDALLKTIVQECNNKKVNYNEYF